MSAKENMVIAGMSHMMDKFTLLFYKIRWPANYLIISSDDVHFIEQRTLTRR